MEVSAVRSAVLANRNFSSTESSSSKGPLWSPAKTIERSQDSVCLFEGALAWVMSDCSSLPRPVQEPHTWASPGCGQRAVTWTACDSRGRDGGRAVTCGVIVYLPTGWCTRQPQCCPCGLARACQTAVAGTAVKLAHSSRQLMCQSSRGPVQSPEAACPLHVAPQPVLEASVVTKVCRDTCYRGTPACRKARSIQGPRERRHCEWCLLEVYRGAMPTSGLGSIASAEVVSYEATQAAWLQLRMPYAPGASETVSVVPHSCFWRNSGSLALLEHARPWGMPSYSPSLTPHREKTFSAQGRVCSFPSWPDAPTGWGAEAPSPCDRTTALWIGPR